MEILINVRVTCTDGPDGRSTRIVMNPHTNQVTHLVVESKDFPWAEHLVPVEMVQSSSPEEVVLKATRQELASLEPFAETEFIPGGLPGYGAGSVLFWPYGSPAINTYVVEHEHVPPDELALQRGIRVMAQDGPIGKIDELVVEPENGHITHLVLREGHLWGQKDVVIPIEQVSHIDQDAVYLKLNKQEVGEQPAIPIPKRKKHA